VDLGAGGMDLQVPRDARRSRAMKRCAARLAEAGDLCGASRAMIGFDLARLAGCRAVVVMPPRVAHLAGTYHGWGERRRRQPRRSPARHGTVAGPT